MWTQFAFSLINRVIFRVASEFRWRFDPLYKRALGTAHADEEVSRARETHVRVEMMNVGRWSRSISDPESLYKTIQQLIVCCPLIPHELLHLSMKITHSSSSRAHLIRHERKAFKKEKKKIIRAINKDPVSVSAIIIYSIGYLLIIRFHLK